MSVDAGWPCLWLLDFCAACRTIEKKQKVLFATTLPPPTRTRIWLKVKKFIESKETDILPV